MGLIKDYFDQGDYKQVLEKTYENSQSLDLSHYTYIIGSLSFLGRAQEAEVFYTSHRPNLNPTQKAYSYFFLALAFTRRSQYKKAKHLLLLNKALLKKTTSANDEIQFLVEQGISFFLFFLGEFEKSLKWSKKSLSSAMQTQNFWMKTLAYDLLANNLIFVGSIHEALRHFDEALKFSKKLKNQSLISAIEVSQLIAKCEYGIEIKKSFTELEKKLSTLKQTDSYSKANLGLEYARQLTLQGQWALAVTTLNEISPLIYQSQNRRQEVRLNLRWAEIYYLKNEPSTCLHYLRSGQLGLEFVDQTFEIQLLGLQIKVYEDLMNSKAPSEAQLRFDELNVKFHTIKNMHMLLRNKKVVAKSKTNSDDQIHQYLLKANENTQAAKKVILETNYFSWLYRFFDLQKGETYLLLNFEPKSITCVSPLGLLHLPNELSTLNYKILSTLKKDETSKEDLVSAVWGYKYDPLRHDSLIYSAFSNLRKALGPYALMIKTSELGYCLQAQVINLLEQMPSLQILATPDDLQKDLLPVVNLELNARQIQILQFLERNQFLGVKKATQLFNTSEITANRDLRSLFEKNLVLRVGQGRATQYTKRRTS